MSKSYKKVLSIAGSDSGGGAGIQADIKAISACGSYAMTAITAITVQNTLGVAGIHPVPSSYVADQMAAVIEDIGVDAVKIGMLPSIETVERVADVLRRYGISRVVVDPVMVSTSGSCLSGEEVMASIRELLFPLAELITPNIPEAEFLTGLTIRSDSDFAEAAAELQSQGAKNVLLKAGHCDGGTVADHLYEGKQCTVFRYDRIETNNTHGTGCTLSSAIAAFLAQGYSLREAVERAEAYVHEAIRRGSDYAIGHGHGPLHHFYRFWE